MKTLKGVSAQGGIARGVVCLYSGVAEESVPHYSVSPGQAQKEIEKLKNAFETAKDEMRRMIGVAAENGDAWVELRDKRYMKIVSLAPEVL